MAGKRHKPLPPGVQERTDKAGRITYYARWYDKRGRRHGATFDTATQASDHLADMRRQKRMGRSADPSGETMRFGDWWEKWFAGRQIRPSTAIRDDSHARHRILPEWGDVRLGDIELDDINIWVKSLEMDGELGPLAPATAAKHLNLLSQCLGAAVVSGKIAANPASLANVPRIPEREARFLTVDELVDLEDATAKYWQAVVAFMGDIGPRIGEVGALRVYDVDLLGLKVRIRETVAYEKGGRALGPTKTVAGYRTVPFLSPEVAEQVSRFIRDNNRSGTDLLFGGPRGGPFDPRNFRDRVFNPAVEAAGLAEPLPTPHALRHTAISRWIAGGTTDVKKLATAAGHKKVAVFFDKYGHLLPYDARPTIDALSQQRAEALERKRERQRWGGGSVTELARRTGGS